MNLHKIGVVISREYLTRVKKKSFLITTFVVPILFAALCILPAFLLNNIKEKAQSVVVIDNSGIVLPYLEDSDAMDFTDCTGRDPEEVKQEVMDG
ncbi:MAG: hypothetical protein II095_03315 [Bacteroidales bacterium]|nr:hypothetical protein [Bacteroidales bacterium]